MNTIRKAAMKQATCLEQAEAGMEADPRIIKPDAFQKKYDSMLNLVEFMAGLYLMETRSPRTGGEMQELKSLVAQARKSLSVSQGRTVRQNETTMSDMGGKHGC